MRRRDFLILVGGAVAWPLAAAAEPIRNKYRLAIVTPVATQRDTRRAKEFFDLLSRAGYVEGQNLVVEFFQPRGKVNGAQKLRAMPFAEIQTQYL